MKDLLLLRRIRTLSWLEPVHLDLALNLESEEVQAMVSKGREGKAVLVQARVCMQEARVS